MCVCVYVGSPRTPLEERGMERKGSTLGSPVALQPELGIPGKEVVRFHCYSGGPSVLSGFCSSVVSLFCYSSSRCIFSLFPLLIFMRFFFSPHFVLFWSLCSEYVLALWILTCHQNLNFCPHPSSYSLNGIFNFWISSLHIYGETEQERSTWGGILVCTELK